MPKIKIVLLIALLFSVCIIALFFGPRGINPLDMSDIDRTIVFSIRLPRVLISLLMGMALGASGAVLQGILRNPLADPYILGISSGASLFAAFGIIMGFSFIGTFTIPALAFTGAILTGVIVGIIGRKKGGIWPERLLLAGVGLSFLFSALKNRTK